MDAHEETSPVLLRKPTTDAQRAELLLRRQYNYLRRKTNPSPELRAVLEQIESRMSFVSGTTTCKTDQPPEVLALLDQIKCLSLQVPDLKQCLTVPLWCLSSEDSESCEVPVYKRRRLLVKTKAPSLL
jgi:hypothetical protein